MSKPVLIVGGGPAGLAAAHSLATVGKKSVIVEKEDRLGGAPILSGYAKLVPTGEWAKDAIGGMVDRVTGNQNVDVRTGSEVTSFDGEPGSFSVGISGAVGMGEFGSLAVFVGMAVTAVSACYGTARTLYSRSTRKRRRELQRLLGKLVEVSISGSNLEAIPEAAASDGGGDPAT